MFVEITSRDQPRHISNPAPSSPNESCGWPTLWKFIASWPMLHRDISGADRKETLKSQVSTLKVFTSQEQNVKMHLGQCYLRLWFGSLLKISVASKTVNWMVFFQFLFEDCSTSWGGESDVYFDMEKHVVVFVLMFNMKMWNKNT